MTMASRVADSALDVRTVLLENFAANNAMNQLLLAHLDPQVWRLKPTDPNQSEARTLAGIFAHMHNNRRSWIKRSAPHLKCPALLVPEHCTIKQTRAAHRQSTSRCLQMLREVLSDRKPRRVTKFSRGSWATDWPAGVTMFTYMFAHDAHRRGQITMLARQLGYQLPEQAAYGIWRWERLWQDCGFKTRPR